MADQSETTPVIVVKSTDEPMSVANPAAVVNCDGIGVGDVPIVLTGSDTEPAVTPAKGSKGGHYKAATATFNRRMQQGHHYVEQKGKRLRDMWLEQQHRLLKLNRDHSQLIIIALLSTVAIVCSIAALTTASWTCSSDKGLYFGLWNTCFVTAPTVGDNFTTTAAALNTTAATAAGIVCAHQGLYEVHVKYAEQSRIDQVSAAQGLMVCGTILHAISLVTIALAYKYMHVGCSSSSGGAGAATINLNSVRNALVISMCVQIVSFFMQLIGFFLFVFTDRFSISVSLLFVYFGLAMLASNIVNFISIEYKSFKTRQLSI